MESKVELGQNARFEIVRAGQLIEAPTAVEGPVPFVGRSPMAMKGRFVIEHFRDGQSIGQYSMPNGIVDVGLNHILEVEFNGGSQITTWYLGLIDNSGFSALAAGDTMASHAGWSESSDYDEATRPEWTAGTAASRQITNATAVDFTIDATKTIKGIFVTSNNTKGGTTGTLWATAAFASTVSVQDNDVLKVYYTVSG